MSDVLAAEIPANLRHALQTPRGGIRGVGDQSDLFDGFDLEHRVGQYPTGLDAVDVPEADQVRSVAPSA